MLRSDLFIVAGGTLLFGVPCAILAAKRRSWTDVGTVGIVVIANSLLINHFFPPFGAVCVTLPALGVLGLSPIVYLVRRRSSKRHEQEK
jgi:hypothetical protein